MKLYFADKEEETDGFSTSFFFDEEDDQFNFLAWLDKMDISYLKSKMPVFESGKLTYKNAVIINRDGNDNNNVQSETEQLEEHVEEEKPKETSSRKKKKSKNSLDEQPIE